MPQTLHELANKLQESIIQQQEDAHNSSSLNVSKYNNLKLKMDTKYNYPHVIVAIGISEAVYNIKEMTKTEGGLGPDERYVRKWLGKSTIAYDLNEIWMTMGELVSAQEAIEEEQNNLKQEGVADESKIEAPNRSFKKKKRRKFEWEIEEEEEEANQIQKPRLKVNRQLRPRQIWKNIQILNLKA